MNFRTCYLKRHYCTRLGPHKLIMLYVLHATNCLKMRIACIFISWSFTNNWIYSISITDEIMSNFTHLQDQIYECNICHRPIKKKGGGIYYLREHYVYQHTVTEKMNCGICHKMFKNAKSLRHHKYHQHK